MKRFRKSLVLLLTAAIASASVPLSSSAYVTDEAIRYYRSQGYTSWSDVFAAEYNQIAENTENRRTDWPREVADTPVESIYNGTPENDIEGQFDMAGAIKAFEYAQLHRFPSGIYEQHPLKAYVWDDTLAGFAQKLLQDEVTLGVYNRGCVIDSTGRYDQSRVYSCETYFLGTSGYPYDIRMSNTYRGKTLEEAFLNIGSNDGLRSPLIQNDVNMKVGAAVLNHNGEKLLLFLKSEEGKTYTWKYINEHGGVDNAIKNTSMLKTEYLALPAY